MTQLPPGDDDPYLAARQEYSIVTLTLTSQPASAIVKRLCGFNLMNPLNRENLRDALIAKGIALLVGFLSGCTPQQSASLMPMVSMGSSMSTQAANLYFEQQRMQQQAELQRQQQELQYLQQQQRY
jgi:hypothetical protein